MRYQKLPSLGDLGHNRCPGKGSGVLFLLVKGLLAVLVQKPFTSMIFPAR